MTTDRRVVPICFVAWAAAILVPLGVLLGVGVPWWQRISDLDRQIESRVDQIERYRSLLASLPQLRAELERERSKEDVRAFYYEADTPALAGAQLQRELQDMVRAAGARLINAQFLQAGADEQPPRVRIRMQIQGPTDALLDLLFSIEQTRPFLFIDQLSIRSTVRRSPRRTSGIRARRNLATNRRPQGLLTVRLDVFGYALGGNQ